MSGPPTRHGVDEGLKIKAHNDEIEKDEIENGEIESQRFRARLSGTKPGRSPPRVLRKSGKSLRPAQTQTQKFKRHRQRHVFRASYDCRNPLLYAQARLLSVHRLQTLRAHFGSRISSRRMVLQHFAQEIIHQRSQGNFHLNRTSAADEHARDAYWNVGSKEEIDNPDSILQTPLIFESHTSRSSSVLRSMTVFQKRIIEHRGFNTHVLRGHPSLRARHLELVGHTYVTSFDKYGGLQYLDEAFKLFRDGLALLPQGHPGTLHLRLGLARALITRLRRLGHPEDLKEGVDVMREAISEFPDGYTQSKRFAIWKTIPGHLLLQDLARFLSDRYWFFGSVDDINEVIELHRTVLSILNEGHPDRGPAIHHLSRALLTRFRRNKDIKDLDEACELAFRVQIFFSPTRRHTDRRWPDLHNLAVGYGTDFLSRPAVLDTLADCLLARYSRGGRPEDINRSAELLREATADLSSVPIAHNRIFVYISLLTPHIFHLAEALCIRFSRMGSSLSDLMEFMDVIQGISDLLSEDIDHDKDGSGSFPFRQGALQFTFTDHRSVMYALQLMSAVADHNVICRMMGAAQRSVFLGFCNTCIRLLAHIAYHGLDVKVRLDTLRIAADAALIAADHALGFHRATVALEMLEAGRALFWTQFLRLRVAFDVLPPRLAALLRDTSRDLAAVSHNRSRRPSVAKSSIDEDDAAKKRELAHKFQLLAADARREPGFERFLLPEPFEHIVVAAKQGPVVVLVAGRTACHAIVLRSVLDKPERILLPSISKAKVIALASQVGFARGRASAMKSERDSGVNRFSKKLGRSGRGDLNEVLAILFRDIVQPVIACLEMKKIADRRRPSRMWWCPSGPFTALPIHAAGIYTGKARESLLDYVVSSYTPTLDTLITARRRWQSVVRDDDTKMLLVAEPTAPGQVPLPNTIEEAKRIRELVPAEFFVNFDPKPDGGQVGATVKGVLRQLPEASVVHLACHGQQDVINPLKSGFILRDGKLKVSDLMETNLSKAYLAVLSACQTATGDKSQPDESVHLAATMLFMGFRSVVGTMWSMHDVDGPHVASVLYRALFKGGRLNSNPDAIPYALDDAIRQLRDRGAHPSRWATFIHLGI